MIRDNSHNFGLDSVCFAPSTHYPGVVESYDSHDIDGFPLELLEVFNVAW